MPAQSWSERLGVWDIGLTDDAIARAMNWLRLVLHVHPRALRFVVVLARRLAAEGNRGRDAGRARKLARLLEFNNAPGFI